MKKNILLLAILFSVGVANAQTIENIRVSFTQTLFPKKTLPANVKNYNVTVTTPYLKDDSSFRKIAEEKYQKDLNDFPNVIKASEKNYTDVTLVEYAKKVAEAKEIYKLESDQFN